MMSGAEVLFTPHLVPMSRGILATCYAKATGPCDPLAILRDGLCRRALRPCRRDAAGDQMGDGIERRLPHRAV